MKYTECPYCQKKISNNNYTKHIKSHETHPDYQKTLSTNYTKTSLICRYCLKKFDSVRGTVAHERFCKKNPEAAVSYFVTYNKKKECAWNKGLTKETDERVAKQSVALSNYYLTHNGTWQDKQLPDIMKENISQGRKKYLSEHPDKVPYLVNHSSHTSYPELYFIDLFKAENIDLQYHLQVSKYQLDFYNLIYMIDLEIDGDQHYLDKRIQQSDKERDIYLTNLGWKIYRIKWSEYKQMSLNSRQTEIENIKKLFQIK